jgi:hypothetical protein
VVDADARVVGVDAGVVSVRAVVVVDAGADVVDVEAELVVVCCTPVWGMRPPPVPPSVLAVVSSRPYRMADALLRSPNPARSSSRRSPWRTAAAMPIPSRPSSERIAPGSPCAT